MSNTDKREPAGDLPTNHEDANIFLASVADNLQDSVVTINLQGIITSWNQSASRIYGYPPEQAIGRSIKMLLTGDNFTVLLAAMEQVGEGKELASFDNPLVHKDGQPLNLQVTLAPIKDGLGNIVGVLKVARDFTELQMAQAALAASETRLRAIVEAPVDFGIITVDEQSIIIDWNSGAENLFGYSKEEALGQNSQLMFTPEDKHAGIPQIELETAKRTGRSIDERWHLHKDGSRFFMSGVMTSAIDSSGPCYVKVARDITDRKLAEEALLMSEQRKSLAVQSAEMGEWEWELATDEVKISDQCVLLLGLPAGQTFISSRDLHEMVFPDDQPAVQRQLEATFSGLNIFQIECRMVRADSRQLRWVNAYGRIVAHEGDQPSKMIGVLYDITPRKILEKQKDDFISMASHELKTPLTAIKTYSDLLEEKLQESAEDENLLLLRKLNGQVDRLIALMQDLLDSSNLSEGRIKLNPQSFDLNVMLHEHHEALETLAADHQIIWKTSAIPLLHADKDRILQVIDNFVGNAVKYSPKGTQIIITTEDQFDQVRVSVQDQGMGIPLEAQAFVFERYYRGEHTAGDKGFGLGLYICAQIIKEHHGSIGLSSSPGQGSTFYFSLLYR